MSLRCRSVLIEGIERNAVANPTTPNAYTVRKIKRDTQNHTPHSREKVKYATEKLLCKKIAGSIKATDKADNALWDIDVSETEAIGRFEGVVWLLVVLGFPDVEDVEVELG